ncbi:unnamed protein product [Cylindrotheca closterium]|uniref:Uncharacterized protein n=1 Tax=Cylindrotheca closterium TaxID=2856 RepID=A0AAD2PUS9_9STRA|nr:unnamed protein product [Cylindrotheca closterium]
MGISNKDCRLGIGDFKVEVIELHLLDLCGQFGIQSRSGQESIPVTVLASRHEMRFRLDPFPTFLVT